MILTHQKDVRRLLNKLCRNFRDFRLFFSVVFYHSKQLTNQRNSCFVLDFGQKKVRCPKFMDPNIYDLKMCVRMGSYKFLIKLACEKYRAINYRYYIN